MLEDMVNHYNSSNRSQEDCICRYIPLDKTKSEGCAIGRLLPKSYKKRVLTQKLNSQSVKVLFGYLGVPKKFKGIDKVFLRHMQILHDESENWDDNGLSPLGHENYLLIKKQVQNNEL